MQIIKRILFMSVGLFLAESARADGFEFYDRSKDVDWLTPSYWKVGGTLATQLPGAGDTATAAVNSGADITVSLTNSYSAELRALTLKAKDYSSVLHFRSTGEGTVLSISSSSEGLHNTTPFLIQTDTHNNLMTLGSVGTTDAVLKWTNPFFRLSTDAKGLSTMVFESGTFNFYDPEGTAYATHKFTVYGSGAVIVDTNATVHLPILYLCGTAADFRVRGGTVSANGSLEAYDSSVIRLTDGADGTISKLTMRGSAKILVDSGATLTCSGSGSIAAADRPALIVSNATCTIAGSLDDIGGSTDGLLAIYDGQVSVKGADAIKVATGGGNGGVEMHGGTLTTSRIRLSRNAATAANTTYFYQTAGTTELTGTGIQFQQSCTDNNLGTHYVRLDGGVLKAAKIYRDAAVTAGTVYLSADGGTWQPNAAANATLTENLSYGEFGAKGLTLDDGGRNYSLDLVGKDKTGETGLFVKTGSGTLTLKTTSWKVGETVVADGTLKANGDTALESKIVVTNGATFSTVGSATAVTVDGLIVTNGVLALDPGDVLTVNGPFALSRVSLAFSSTPTLAEAQAFLVVKGELDEVMRLELLRAVYAVDLGTGYHAEYETAYDAGTGRTTIKLKKVVTSALTETATWTGTGAWASSENWQDGVKPTEKKIAVFGAAGGEAVVAAGDEAGALSFTAGTHRISGTGPLAMTAAAGETGISVSGGAHILAAPLELVAPVPIALDSETSLALDGNINRGALTKSGTGHLTLGAPLTLDGALKVTDGLVTATNVAAMEATSAQAIELAAGTFEVNAADGGQAEVPVQVNVAGSAVQTSIVFKAATDVTFDKFAGSLGNLIKCGPAKMTIAIPAGKTYTLTPANNNGRIGFTGATSTLSDGILFKDDGTEPDGWRAPLTVVEGELALKGAGDASDAVTAKASVPGHFVIGGPCRSPIAAEPVLTVDHCLATFGDIHNGYSLKGNSGYQISHPLIRVLNGGTFSTGAGQPAGYDCTKSGTDCTFAITNGTLSFTTKGVYLTRGRIDGSASREIIVKYLLNGSEFSINAGKAALLDGSLYVDNDNGSFFGGTDNGTLAFNTVNNGRVYGEIYTHNGSTLAMSGLTETATQTRSLIFAFDDGEWIWSATGATATWPASTRGNVFEMRGRGVILKPAEGQTFTTLAPFTGTGGVVVDGPGTVAFGAKDTYLCTGVCDVEEGTIDLTAHESQIAALSFAGTGTVKGAKVTTATVAARFADDWTTQELPIFTDCTLGKLVIDAGRTSENPLALPATETPIAVAKFAGTTAAPSSIRLRNTGARGIRGAFTVVGDTLYMTPCRTGFILMLK